MSVSPINGPCRTAAVEAVKPRADAPAAAASRGAAPVRAAEALALSGTAVAAAMAAAPPVDTARVAAIQAAIADGSYRIDADAIAGRMIALDLPGA